MTNETHKEELIKIWTKALEYIEKKISDPKTFDALFDQTKLMALSSTTATITTPGAFPARILRGSPSFVSITTEALKSVTSTDYELNFVDEKSFNKKNKKEGGDGSSSSWQFFATAHLDKELNFDNFVQGDSNLDAYHAAVMSVSSPGNFNPIFIYSTTGYGKTHLLNAIGNAYAQKYPEKKVLYTNTDQFIDEFVKFATGNSDSQSFKDFFKSIDILLMDDIQFLKDKTQTSAFFFNVFNNMVTNHKQIVVTSDRSPSELDGLQDRLISRFSSGLTIQIKKPQPNTMLDILKMKIVSLHLDVNLFEPDSLDYLVNHNPGNIRAMEGELNKILFISTSRQNTGKITADFCKQAFGDRKGRGTGDKDPVSPSKIIAAVCGYYNVTETQIRSKVKTLQIAMARQISMYLCRSLLDMSFKDIGKEFGRDHSTVMTAVKKVSDQTKLDKALQSSISEISRRIGDKNVGKSA